MKESELRVLVSKKLHRQDMSEEIWQDLNDLGYVEAALDPALAQGFKELVKRAKSLYKRFGSGAGRKQPPGRPTPVVTPPKLHTREQARAQAFSEFLGHHIDTIPRVRRLRAALLGGSLLSPTQAEAFLLSPALRMLSAEQCRELKIPILDHQAYIMGEPEENQTVAGRVVHATLHIEWPGGSYEGKVHCQEREAYKVTHIKTMVFRPPGTRRLEYCVWPMSVVGQIHECGDWLAELYPWNGAHAAWFLLTGNFPHVAPVELGMQVTSHSDLQRYQITLAVEPWISAETVLRAYRTVQRMVLGGRDNRPMQERSLTLVRFIASQRVAQGKQLPWKCLMAEWNRHYHEWAYSQVSNFAKDVDRAEQAFRFPQWHWHWKAEMGPGISWHPSWLSHKEPSFEEESAPETSESSSSLHISQENRASRKLLWLQPERKRKRRP